MSSVATTTNVLGILKDRPKGLLYLNMHSFKDDVLTEVLVDNLLSQESGNENVAMSRSIDTGAR